VRKQLIVVGEGIQRWNILKNCKKNGPKTNPMLFVREG
jgi:hypothetical protein